MKNKLICNGVKIRQANLLKRKNKKNKKCLNISLRLKFLLLFLKEVKKILKTFFF